MDCLALVVHHHSLDNTMNTTALEEQEEWILAVRRTLGLLDAMLTGGVNSSMILNKIRVGYQSNLYPVWAGLEYRFSRILRLLIVNNCTYTALECYFHVYVR